MNNYNEKCNLSDFPVVAKVSQGDSSLIVRRNPDGVYFLEISTVKEKDFTIVSDAMEFLETFAWLETRYSLPNGLIREAFAKINAELRNPNF